MAVSANAPFRIVDRFAPDLAPYLTSLGALQTGERALTALPYAIIVR
jgi:hypothetical protein